MPYDVAMEEVHTACAHMPPHMYTDIHSMAQVKGRKWQEGFLCPLQVLEGHPQRPVRAWGLPDSTSMCVPQKMKSGLFPHPHSRGPERNVGHSQVQQPYNHLEQISPGRLPEPG
jgi:hypothetical protein